MKLVLAIAEFIGAGLLITKAITGASWAQVISGQAENVYKASQAGQNTTTVGTGSAIVATSSDIVTAKGGGKLNRSQLTFAKQLANDTGLSLAVVEGWVASEEPASSGQAPNGPDNWLNIGATGSADLGGSDSFWDNPTSAANETASWLEGQSPVPGFGYASSGIRSIISSAGQSIDEQVAAIQNSGWAASHYPHLAAVVSEFL